MVAEHLLGMTLLDETDQTVNLLRVTNFLKENMEQDNLEQTLNNRRKYDAYYRAGIAMPIDRKPILTSRLSELGLKTIGELVNMFVLTDPSIVGALKPYADEMRTKKANRSATSGLRKEAANQLKDMSPEELKLLIELARSQKTSPAE